MRAEVQDEGQHGRKVAPSDFTIAKLLDGYITHCETQDRSPTTLHEYRRLPPRFWCRGLAPSGGRPRPKPPGRPIRRTQGQGTRCPEHSPRSFARVVLAPIRTEEGHREAQCGRECESTDLPRLEAVSPTLEQVREVITAAEATDPMLATIITVTALTRLR